MIEVTVVCAWEHEQTVLPLAVAEGSCVAEVLEASGIADRYPQLSLAQVGIYGELVTPEWVVSAGDRIEIYRPLQIDPMEARRIRAGKRVRKT